MRRPRPVANAWYLARGALADSRLGLPLLRFTRGQKQIVSAESDVCIDGFARSANTFAYHAFADANPGVRVAHHAHAPEQILRAVRRGIPCAVLIRAPLDTAISQVVMSAETVSPGLVLRAWCRFYERVAGVRDRVVICEFGEVLADPATIARRLNREFGTAFVGHSLDERERRELLERIERYNRNRGMQPEAYTVPAPEKRAPQARLRERLVTHRLLSRAEAIYAELTGTGSEAPKATPVPGSA